MPPKDNSERACEECLHYWACSRQCGEPMAQSSATGCECYETIKSSMAYYVGTLDGVKGKIQNRLRELAEADEDGRVVVLPCKLGTKVYRIRYKIADYPDDPEPEIATTWFTPEYREDIGKTVFLSREEAEKALQEMEGKKDGKT